GAVAHEDAIGIDDGDRRPREFGQVDYTGVNILVQPNPRPAHDADPVLHAQGNAAQAVMFSDRDVDYLIGGEQGLQHGPRTEVSWQVNPLEVPIFGQDHFRAFSARGFSDATAAETAPGVVATHVSDGHLPRPGLP